jgi:hypothetical protein
MFHISKMGEFATCFDRRIKSWYVLFLPNAYVFRKYIGDPEEILAWAHEYMPEVGVVVDCYDFDRINIIRQEMTLVGFSEEDLAMFNKMIKGQRKEARKYNRIRNPLRTLRLLLFGLWRKLYE